MSLEYIREHYRVPAQIGGRIKFTWPDWTGNRYATIVGAEGSHLKVGFDSGEIGSLHPTWEISYLYAPAGDAA